jgi:hypothetical protein
VDGDGDYLLVLKMSEVYFNAPNMKVFDVVLNGDLTISSDLDIFEKVNICSFLKSNHPTRLDVAWHTMSTSSSLLRGTPSSTRGMRARSGLA